MRLYTYQIGQWRRVQQLGIPMLDTTVKSGAHQVAPTWDIVLGVKRGIISEDEYRAVYRSIFEYWWFEDPLWFEALIAQPVMALGCYCAKGKFCHRHELVIHLSCITEVDYLGEL